MKYIVLTKSTMAWELSDEGLGENQHQKNLDEYIDVQKEIASMYDMSHIWSESVFIDKSKHSVSPCSSCGEWSMDRESNPIKEKHHKPIKDGYSIDGKLLCYSCLPAGHRWSWS